MQLLSAKQIKQEKEIVNQSLREKELNLAKSLKEKMLEFNSLCASIARQKNVLDESLIQHQKDVERKRTDLEKYLYVLEEKIRDTEFLLSEERAKDRDQNIRQREDAVLKHEEDLFHRKTSLEKRETFLEIANNQLSSDKRALESFIDEVRKKNEILDQLSDSLEDRVDAISLLEKRLNSSKEEWTVLLDKERQLNADEHAANVREKEFLVALKKQLESERCHIESQQESLKEAFNEAKNKGII